jgi:uncharacterized LabA/DUF88 family protein
LEHPLRVCAYIDGFNAYHAIDAIGDPILKWLDYHSLAASMLEPGDTLERVVFYTAITPWSAEKRKRHMNYVTALRATGVEVVESKFTRPSKFCKPQGIYCRNYEEKQTDVAIATDVLTDSFEGRAERVLLFTADSDQIPLVRRVKGKFPNGIVVLVAPPGRLNQARELGQHCDAVHELKARILANFLLPPELLKPNGKPLALCPPEYGPHPLTAGSVAAEEV